MSPRSRLLLILVTALAAVAATGGRAQAATCPTFSVLHDDQIGALKLPAGPYAVSTSKLTCSQSTVLFAEFLNDFDGKLRAPWKTTVLGVGHGRFAKPGGTSFTVTKTTKPSGGGGGTSLGLVCATPYRVTRSERIQTLKIKAGRYRITRLGTSISCGKAASLLSTFLRDFTGPLPGGWTLLADSGAFVKGSLTNGFLIEPWRSSGGGGGTPIVTKDIRCPGTFQVLHRDHIGKLQLAGGPYKIYVLKGSSLACSAASNRFRIFLDSVSGVLPSPWKVDVGTATFRKGSGKTAFRVKPA